MNRHTRVMVAGAIVAAVSLVINHVSAIDLDLPQAPTSHTATAPTGPAAQTLAQLGATATDVDADYDAPTSANPGLTPLRASPAHSTAAIRPQTSSGGISMT